MLFPLPKYADLSIHILQGSAWELFPLGAADFDFVEHTPHTYSPIPLPTMGQALKLALAN